MPGRRRSEGLHQAVEAKEGVPIQAENQTLASITFQNYFRLYDKLAGMTGTADTEAFEFRQIYGLEVVVIPTNRPIARKDFNDLVYLTQDEKYAAIITDMQQCQALGRPILVGTASIETSEYVSQLLQKAGIEHKVLNAKYHEKEAEIVAQAGRPGSVTIATNMAGRGTDILLGGNWEVEVAALENPTDEQIAQIKADWQKRHEAGDGGGRPAHHRHRAPRVPPYRQPAARPCRSSGRPGFVPLLPVAGRPPDAHLRLRPGEELHEGAGHAAGRGDRAPHGDQRHREGPAQGRRPQLRHPQATAGIRRRRQRAAQGDLPHAQHPARGRRRRRDHRRDSAKRP